MINPNDYICSEDKLLCVHTFRKYGEENSMLWQQELILSNNSHPFIFRWYLHLYIDSCFTGVNGLYGQVPISREHGNKDDDTSPDQLIAMMSHFYSTDRLKAMQIWTYLWTHLFTYDNINKRIDFKRTMQPSAVFFSAVCAGHKIVLPLLSLVCIISCMSKRSVTSGKLKAWTMMRTLHMGITFRICTWLVKDWNIVSGIYFHQKNHPLQIINNVSFSGTNKGD